MESSAASAHVALANNSHFEPADRFARATEAMTVPNPYSEFDPAQFNAMAGFANVDDLSFAQPAAFTNPFRDSNERGTGTGTANTQQVAPIQHDMDGAGDLQDVEGASGLQPAIATPATNSAPHLFAHPDHHHHHAYLDTFSPTAAPSIAGTIPASAVFPYSTSESEHSKPENMSGYAQLCFQDGEYIINTLAVSLGRDTLVQRQYEHDLKRHEVERQHAQAEVDLQRYRQEPSHASGPDENPSSRSDPSLEGRIPNAIPSMCSEQGGIVNFNRDEDESRLRRKERKLAKLKKQMSGQSSSTGSVNPARLHKAFSYNEHHEILGDDGEMTPFVAVHPTDISHINKISREHLRIAYNSSTSHWEMQILGNSALVLNEHSFVAKDSADDWEDWRQGDHKCWTRGESVVLTHNTEVQVATLFFRFKLPPGPEPSNYDSDSEMGESVDGDAEPQNSSPARRLSAAVSGDGSEVGDAVNSEEELPLAAVSKKKEKKSKRAKQDSKQKSGLKLKLKAPKADVVVAPPPSSPETLKKPEKGKKPKKAEKSVPPPDPAVKAESSAMAVAAAVKEGESAGPVDPGETTVASAPPKAKAPEVPLTFEPGTLLGDARPEELPEKRKGPGRPPKNGLVSKRDSAIMERKYREYDKAGIQRPPVNEMLRIVRAENKAKEAAAKAAAKGEMAPAMSGNTQVMQSIESGDAQLVAALTGASGNASYPTARRMTGDALARASADAADAADAESKAEAKRQRTWRSPSPMKPRDAYTDEEIKKPSHTYYYTLDEILNEGPPEGLELQQIYDKICKKYPYYRYGADSNGWQSSVRHNLKQHERFQQISKQGKGWMWTINKEVPFDKEKKRKPTPPRTQAPPQQQPTQQQQFQYGNPYGGQYQQHPGQQYASPYQGARPGQQYGTPGFTNQQQYAYPAGQHPPPRGSNGSVPPQQRPQPQEFQQYDSLVTEIMALRRSYVDDPQRAPALDQKQREMLFDRAVRWVGNQEDLPKVFEPVEQKVYDELKGMVSRWTQIDEQRKVAAAKAAPADTAPTGQAAMDVTPTAASTANAQRTSAAPLLSTTGASATAGTATIQPVQQPLVMQSNLARPSAFAPAPAAANHVANAAWQAGASPANGAPPRPFATGPPSRPGSQPTTSGRPTPSPLSTYAAPSPISRPASQVNGLPATAQIMPAQAPAYAPLQKNGQTQQMPQAATNGPPQQVPQEGMNGPPQQTPQAVMNITPQQQGPQTSTTPPQQQVAMSATMQRSSPQQQSALTAAAAQVSMSQQQQQHVATPQVPAPQQPAATLKRSASDEILDGGKEEKRMRTD